MENNFRKMYNLENTLVIFTTILLSVQGGNDFPKDCTQTKPVVGNYTGKGKIFNLGDLPIYETEKEEKKIVLLGYDIFGFHPNTFQIADKLAEEGGFRVVVPDYFKGKPFPQEKFPPKDMNELYAFLGTHSWDKTAKAETLKVIEHYKSGGGVTFASIGFCWGGMVAVNGATQFKDFKTIALVHPSGINEEMVKDVKIPTYLVTCEGDPDLMECYKILQQNLGDKTGYKRYTDVHHGFAMTRGNFNDPLIQQRVQEVLTTVKNFFNSNM